MSALSALSESDPCGPDLEYDPAFMALEGLAKGKAEQQFGETTVAAEPPDWKGVLQSCDTLLTRTLDLRVAVYRARAEICLNGLTGAARGYALVDELIERFWPDVHPRLDADDDNDPTMRVNAVSAMADTWTSLPELRSAVWLRARGVQCTVRQALAGLTAQDAGAEPAVSQAEMAGMIAALAPEQRVNSAREALRRVESIQSRLTGLIGAGQAPDLRVLADLLRPLADFFDRQGGDDTAGDSNDTVGSGGDAGADSSSNPSGDGMNSQANRPASGAASAEIRSREDVVRALERACQYLERNEPSHPAPLLIRRAQRLLKMNFLDIMKDMAPDALSTVESIAGTQHSNDSDD